MDQTQPIERRRTLALDVGERRIGVAISDELGILATPLKTIKAEPQTQALHDIVALVHEYEVRELVVGLPLTMNGEVGMQAQVVHTFVAHLESLIERPVHLFDERLTSVMAETMMRDTGRKSSRRKRKTGIDEVAASIILQNYLDRNRNLLAL
jgi:putative Holliday junction resolvase